MKQLLLLLFLGNSFAVFSQQDTTIVFMRPGFEKDPIRSKWTSNVERKDSVWVLSLFDKKQTLKEKITYGDQRLEVRKGPYFIYFEDGSLKENGKYDKGYKLGEWNYYAAKERLSEKANYAWGKLNGNYTSYWENGKRKNEGVYVMDKKFGVWKMFYKSEKIALNETYDETGKLILGSYFDEEGNQKDKLFVIQPPTYEGGLAAFDQYVSQSIKYPTGALKNKIQGTVKLEFTITKDGKVEDISVKESPSSDLSVEAIRLVRNATGWIAGRELGEPTNMKFIVPILFSLGEMEKRK